MGKYPLWALCYVLTYPNSRDVRVPSALKCFADLCSALRNKAEIVECDIPDVGDVLWERRDRGQIRAVNRRYLICHHMRFLERPFPGKRKELSGE